MLNFALIGCGRIAKKHSELLGNNNIKGGRLVAVCDKKLARAQKIGKAFGISSYVNYEEMVNENKIDVFVVLTESGMHAKNVMELAKYGHSIVVEKPMALTLEDADKMIHLCNENNVKLFVIKQNRFNLPVIKLKEAIDQGRFGKLFLGTVRVRWSRTQDYYAQDNWRGTWAMDGGVLTNQASHHIDLLEWIFGEVESVHARSINALADIEAEDTAVATLKFKNNALGIIEATTAIRPKDLEGSISVFGEKGSVEIGGFAVNEIKVWNFAEKLEDDDDIIKNYSVNPPDVYGFGHKAYYEHVIDCINNGKKQLVDGPEGRKSLELINALYESIETGLEVKLNSNIKSKKLGKLKKW